MKEQIEKVLDKSVRPYLLIHGGGIRILSFENGILRIELLGQCSCCPSANLTTKELIQTALTEEVSSVKQVVLVKQVNEELLTQAKVMLSQHG